MKNDKYSLLRDEIGKLKLANNYLRELRNEIAHEYIYRSIELIAIDVMRLTQYLIECINRTIEYCEKKYLGIIV